MNRSSLLGMCLAMCSVFLFATVASGSNVTGIASAQTFTFVDDTQVMIGWDPATAYSEEQVAFVNIYEGLTRYDSSSRTVKPLLATSWKKKNGGKQWTFQLRRGVTFHTGRPFNAAAAKAALMRTIKMGQSASYIWGDVARIDTPGPYTLVFRLKRAAALDLIASSTYAAWIYDVKAAPAKKLAGWFAQGRDAGTGPYTVEQWRKGSEIELRLRQFPGYRGGWKGKKYANVVYRVTPVASTAASLLRSNQVTFVQNMGPQLLASLDGVHGIRTLVTPSLHNVFAMLNTQRPPLDNRDVRQALAWAIDYDGIRAILKNTLDNDRATIPRGLIGFSKDLPIYSQNVTKATTLLQKAGYGPGNKPITLELTYIVGDGTEMTIAQVMKSSLAPLNIQVNTQALQWPVLWDKTKGVPANRQDIVLYIWWPDYADPFSWFVNMFMTEKKVQYNAAYYGDPALDALALHASRATITNRKLAQQLYEGAQAKLLQDVPAIPFGGQVENFAMRDSFSGFRPNPVYNNAVFVYELTPKA